MNCPTVRLRIYTRDGALDKELSVMSSSLVGAVVEAIAMALPMKRPYHVVEAASTEARGRKVMWWDGREDDASKLPKAGQRVPYIEKIVRGRIEAQPQRRCGCTDGVADNGENCTDCCGRGTVADL